MILVADTGPLIAQARCEVAADDDPASLAARVLNLEHRIYPWAVNSIARGQISLQSGEVSYAESALSEAEAMGFLIP